MFDKDPYILDEVADSDFKSKSIFTISRDINNKIVYNLINKIKNFLGYKYSKEYCFVVFLKDSVTKDYRGSVTLKFYEKLEKNRKYQIYLNDPLFGNSEIERLLKTRSENIQGVSNFYDCIVLINNNKSYKNIKISQYVKAMKKNGAIFDYWSLLKNNKAKFSKLNKKIKYFQL